MATAKKLPSGSWRVRVYSHTDSQGKKHYESFTASTKAQAELKANQYLNNPDKLRAADVTVEAATCSYISANQGVLSPSTLYGYEKDAKRFEYIKNIKVRKLNSDILQKYIGKLTDDGLSPKTIKNTYSLLMSVLRFVGIDYNFRVHLPSVAKKSKYAPKIEDIQTLYGVASLNMKKAIMLGCHSLRRGEISALKFSDLNGHELYIHSDMVTDGKKWIHKETPKTASSVRTVYLSDDNLKLIGTGQPDQYIVPLQPNTIGSSFNKLCHKCNIQMRFHDTRVYFSSIAAAMNINDIYISHLGGWRENSAVLKEHYQKPIVSIDKGYANKINDHLDGIFKEV